jgi:signal transduction histidine kinase/DNA-binding NarL/FixJ family response regulator
MTSLPPDSEDLESLQRKLKRLEIRYKQTQNDLFLTQQENRENSLKYVDLTKELSDKNEELQKLKNNLEDLVKEQTAELLLSTEELKQHKKLLSASSQTGTYLLENSNTTEAIQQSLSSAGEAAELSRAYIYQIDTNGTDINLIHCWKSSKNLPSPNLEIIFQHWSDTLKKGQNITGNTNSFNDQEKKLLSNQNIESILIIPLFVYSIFWGFTVFEKSQSDYTWDEVESAVLTSIAGDIGSAIMQKKTSEELEKAKVIAELAAEEAQAGTKAKSEFLSTMSHEIRTPLNGIIGIIDILRGTTLNEEQTNYLQDLNFASETLLSIVNDTLDLAKIESGKLELESASFDLHHLVDKICSTMKHQASSKGLELSLNLAPEIPRHVQGDPVRLRQILMNFIGNSLKFTSKGNIEITVKLAERKENQALIFFEVKDSGIGLNSGQIERLFDKFTQADSSTTRKYGGTGLGLSICKNLIEMMGGEINVESTPGKGSAFSFTIPLTLSEKVQQIDTEIVLDWLKPPSILLAEDSPVNQKIAIKFLKEFGCEVRLAEDGTEAIRLYSSNVFDLILMDIQMPKLDGLEATEIITKMQAGEPLKTPIIAMTANALGNDRQKYQAAGMSGYLFKPFRKNNLKELLAEYLSHLLKSNCTEEEINNMQNPPENTEEAPILDIEKALDTLGGDMELLESTVEIFFEEWEPHMQTINSALQNSDFKTAERTAHTLKSSAGYVSGMRLREKALAAEEAAAKHNPEELKTLIKDLEEEFLLLKKELDNYFKK